MCFGGRLAREADDPTNSVEADMLEGAGPCLGPSGCDSAFFGAFGGAELGFVKVFTFMSLTGTVFDARVRMGRAVEADSEASNEISCKGSALEAAAAAVASDFLSAGGGSKSSPGGTCRSSQPQTASHVREARENKNSAILEGIVTGVIPGEGKSQIQGPAL